MCYTLVVYIMQKAVLTYIPRSQAGKNLIGLRLTDEEMKKIEEISKSQGKSKAFVARQIFIKGIDNGTNNVTKNGV